jgi:hypothetical protein
LGGNHPFLRQEGVVVITDMDGMGSPGGLTVTSPRDVPIGAVALLNVLDHLSAHAARTGWNQRTLISLFASGGIVGPAGGGGGGPPPPPPPPPTPPPGGVFVGGRLCGGGGSPPNPRLAHRPNCPRGLCWTGHWDIGFAS